MAKRKTKKKKNTPVTSREEFYTVRALNPAMSPANATSGPRISNPGTLLTEQVASAARLAHAETSACAETRLRTETKSRAESNPQIRFTTVPVDEDGDDTDDLAFVVRGGTRDEAIRTVARKVDGEAWIDVGLTRSHETKKAALAHAKRIAPRTQQIADRLARGES